MKNLQVNPRWLRVMMLSLLIGTISRPLDFYIGYMFALGRMWQFAIAMVASVVLAVIAEWIWWHVMTCLNEREK